MSPKLAESMQVKREESSATRSPIYIQFVLKTCSLIFHFESNISQSLQRHASASHVESSISSLEEDDRKTDSKPPSVERSNRPKSHSSSNGRRLPHHLPRRPHPQQPKLHSFTPRLGRKHHVMHSTLCHLLQDLNHLEVVREGQLTEKAQLQEVLPSDSSCERETQVQRVP